MRSYAFFSFQLDKQYGNVRRHAGRAARRHQKAYADIITEDQVVVEGLQVALGSRRAARGRRSHLERSTWDLGRYLAKHLLDG